MSEGWVRFEDPVEAKGYAQISNAVMRDGSLSMEAKYLYGLLKSFAWQDPDTYPGVKTLCEAAGVSNHTLGKYLKELVAAELVEVRRRGQGKTNLYTFKKLGRRYAQDGQASSRPEMNTGSHQEMQTGSHNEDTVNEDAENNSPRGAASPAPPAKAMTSVTIQRTEEAGLFPAPHQKQSWGKGWAEYIYVGEDEDPPSAERQFAVLSEIVAAAAGQRGQGRFFLSVQDAVSRVEAKPGTRRKPDEPAQMSTARRKQGYEWLFDERDEREAKRDLDAELKAMRESA